MEIIAHRGASWDAPENTLGAVRLAWQQHADAVEIDVHLTRDQRIVAIHDASMTRVAGSELVVAESTLAELRSLDVGRWKSAEWAGEQVSTLEEIVAELPAGKRLLIEVKCGTEVVPVLCDVLAQSEQPLPQTVVISYSQTVLRQVKQRLPGVPVYPVVAFKKDAETEQWSPPTEQVISDAVESGFDGLDFGDAPIIDDELVSRCHSAGLGVYVWTVNTPEAARRLMDAGVDGIATDRPGWLREQLAKSNADST